MQHHFRKDKIVSLDTAASLAEAAKKAGKKVVTVNGSFDLVHMGHVDILEEAKQQGDVLFVGLNSDASVRDGKGKDRPFISQEERAGMLAALACVDYVTVVDTPYNELPFVFLRAIKPHIHVNGSEYGDPTQWIEWPAMQEVGAEGHTVARRPGFATSDLVKKIKAST